MVPTNIPKEHFQLYIILNQHEIFIIMSFSINSKIYDYFAIVMAKILL